MFLNSVSRTRGSRIFGTGIANAFARAIGLLASMFIISASLSYLGRETFGVMIAATSFVALFSFTDLGLGNGLVNAIADANGRDDWDGIREATSNAFVMLSIICLVFAGVFFSIAKFVPWQTLFNIKSSEAAQAVYPILSIVCLCTVIGMPLSVSARVQSGLQIGYIPPLYEILGAIFSIICVLGAIKLEASAAEIVAAQLVPPLVLRTINSAVFWHQYQQLSPQIADIKLSVMRNLISIGGLFFVLQIAVAVAFQSDVLIIAKLLGADAVPVYAVTLKLFIIPSTMVGFFTIAQWPAYAEASARGDTKWIRQTLVKTSLSALVISVGAGIGLFLAAKPIIGLWVGEAINPSYDLLLAMSIWSVILVYGSVISNILNGLGVVKFQCITASLMAGFNLIFSIALVHNIGVSGAIYGSILAYSIFTIVPTTVYLYRRFRSAM